MDISERTFPSIYDEFAPKIFKFCYFRVSSKEDAEDLTSLTFIRTWDHISAGKEVSNIQALLFRVASNLVIDFYRKHKNKHEISIDNPEYTIDVADSFDFVEQLDLRLTIESVQKNIAKLPDSYREIIVLKYINDLSIKEIAKLLKTTENNISVRIHRATEKLKKITT